MTKEKSGNTRSKRKLNPARFSIFVCAVLAVLVLALTIFTNNGFKGKDPGIVGEKNNITRSDKEGKTEKGEDGKNSGDDKSGGEDKGKDVNENEAAKTTPTPTTTPAPIPTPVLTPSPTPGTGSAYAVNVENVYQADGKKNVYLTIDDGPTENITPKVLDVLKKYDVKATFFLIGNMAERHPEILKRQVSEGHAIGNHTYSHVFKQVYASNDSFMEEVKKAERVFKDILGQDFSTRLFRFPGGSFEDYKQPMKALLKEKGYNYIDWNSLNGDEEKKNPSAEWLVNRVKETAGTKEKVVVLMHDSGNKQTSLEALPGIIEYFLSRGYEFKTLK